MKKTYLIAIAALGLSFAACKKDRVCECTETGTYNGVVDPYTSTSKTTIKKITKSEAKDRCQKNTNTYIDENGDTYVSTYDCKLK